MTAPIISRDSRMTKILLALAFSLAPVFAFAAGSTYPMDPAPNRSTDLAALQNGARLFVNYCLNCHSANLMRYNRLRDIGLTEEQIKSYLLFTGRSVGETMHISMTAKDGKDWFGVAPPDLSVITRAKGSFEYAGPDYIYTYLRTYYRDASKPHGWNNLAYPNTAMPHVFWERQGRRELSTELVHEVKETGKPAAWERVVTTYDANGLATVKKAPAEGTPHAAFSAKFNNLEPAKAAQFDRDMADLTGFLTYMSDPSANTRYRLGVWVLIFLGFFTVIAMWLSRVYWRDVK
jgi:ubiquinol-cytochrome c reductase cytochrome c1 subunit